MDQAPTFGSARLIIPAGIRRNGIYEIDGSVTAAGMGKILAPGQAPDGSVRPDCAHVRRSAIRQAFTRRLLGLSYLRRPRTHGWDFDAAT
jgi:hypothetical protein